MRTDEYSNAKSEVERVVDGAKGEVKRAGHHPVIPPRESCASRPRACVFPRREDSLGTIGPRYPAIARCFDSKHNFLTEDDLVAIATRYPAIARCFDSEHNF